MTASGDIFIDEIWSLDVIQQGDSGLINADKLGMLCEQLLISATLISD